MSKPAALTRREVWMWRAQAIAEASGHEEVRARVSLMGRPNLAVWCACHGPLHGAGAT